MSGNYDDIIGLPHHASTRHPRLSRTLRAAQFSPFAALTGYDKAIKESARLTDAQIILDENAKEALDRKLGMLKTKLEQKPMVTITAFAKDARKDGGTYNEISGRLMKIDEENQTIEVDHRRIPVCNIVAITIGNEGKLYPEA